MWLLVTNKRYRIHVKNVRQKIPCNSRKWDVFSFHNQFWFLAVYLVGLAQRIPQLIYYWVIQNDCGQVWQLCTKIYVATVWMRYSCHLYDIS
jgi:hypothetical protein